MKKTIIILAVGAVALFFMSFMGAYLIYKDKGTYFDRVLDYPVADTKKKSEIDLETAAKLNNNMTNDDNQDGCMYYIKNDNNLLTVYRNDGTVFENTDVKVDSLDDNMKAKVNKGIYFKDYEELFTFLESYSS